ncbi:MAG: hypothetical protein EXS13_14805 [Planctomycetes bacterium]|nr:hypothetical protein [Planctomycetota bacterium]
MSFLRTLLLTLLLPALLLPEGAKVCLHFLLCAHEATSGCCKVATAGPAGTEAGAAAIASEDARRSCCSNCESRTRQPDPERPRLAAERVDCCVKVPATPIAAATLRVESSGASSAIATASTTPAADADGDDAPLFAIHETPWHADPAQGPFGRCHLHDPPPRPPPSLRFAVPLHL